MSRLVRSLASHMLLAASRLLPPDLSSWSRAMVRELAEIDEDASALRFAAGCLRAAAALAIAARLRAIATAAPSRLSPLATPTWSLSPMYDILKRPRSLGLLCAAIAVVSGLAYMYAGGAPTRYLVMNLAALVLGATAWLALGRTAGSRLAGAGAATLALAVPLLLTAMFGVVADGASRWVSVGPISVQVSLIVLPAMIVLYARRPDPVGTAGMAVAALALAIQPDRAMAGVLLAGLLALLATRPGRLPALACAAAALGFGWTLLAPDRLPSSAFVDGVLFSAFDVHPVAGLAVVLGAASLLVPAAIGLARGAGDRAALLAFGGCWSAVIAAAALGNYPTPLVGYGGSAVLGYLLSAALLSGAAPGSRREAAPASQTAAVGSPARPLSELRAAPLA